MKKFYYLIALTILLLTLPIAGSAACNILIDGKPLTAKDASGNEILPFVSEGTTYVPVRAVSDAFNTEIFWNQETKTVYIGKEEGKATLNDFVNIFANGEEFVATNSNGERVYPILQDGSTYLPLRAIGELFGKTVTWDQDNQTALLTTPPSENAKSYLSECIKNTAALPDLTASVLFKGDLLLNSTVTSQVSTEGVEKYTPGEFSLSAFLPEDYVSYAAYNSNGSFFLHLPSEDFSRSPYVQKVFLKREIQADFSPIYMYLDTKGGYITSVKIYVTTDITHANIDFEQNITINADLKYPEGFTFPLTPYPDKVINENEESVSASTDEDSDAVAISNLLSQYITECFEANPKNIIKMLHNRDYVDMFYYLSEGQYKVNYNKMEKKLKKLFGNANGEYTVDTMVYTTPETPSEEVEKTAKVTLSYIVANGDETSAEEYVVTLYKTEGKWYPDRETINALLN